MANRVFQCFSALAVLLLLAACSPGTATSPTAAATQPTALAAGASTAGSGSTGTTETAEQPAAKTLAADYFSNKTVTFLVNYSAGGATDIFARLVAQHVARHIPGKPNVIVQNMPGAGGLIGINHVYNVAKKDGLTVGVFTSPFSAQVLGAEGVQYDASRFLWLGGAGEASIAFARKDLGAATVEQLPGLSDEIVVGGHASDNSKDLRMRTFLNALGAKYKYVTGYPGDADARAAFARAEINYHELSLTGWVTNVVPMIQEGEAIPVAQTGVVRNGELGRDPRVKAALPSHDIPTYAEVLQKLKGESVKSDVNYRAMTMLVGQNSMIRAIVTPPEVDPAVVAVLRQAIADTFEDEQFKAGAQKQLGYEFVFNSGEEAQALAARIIKESQEDSQALEHIKRLAREEG